MKQPFLYLIILLLAITGCNLTTQGEPEAKAESTKVVVILTKAPTATNFPRAGTATARPPTPTPRPTPTSMPSQNIFDDETLAELMIGTIAAAGVTAQVNIVDERASGGERMAYITLVSKHNIDENDLLLKLFIFEVGSALRTLRAFSDGTIDADLDATFITVNNREGELMGTVKAPTEDINGFLEGRSSVNETLARLELTGVFESFKQ